MRRGTWGSILAVGALVASAVAGVGIGAGPALAAKPAAGLEGIPKLKHVFVIVLENEDFSKSWGPSSPATYLNSLVPQGAFATNYYGVGHVSADNYIAMTSGQTPTPLFMSDCLNWAACETFEKGLPDGGRSVADQLEERHLSWTGYMDSMSRPCQHPAVSDPTDPFQTGYATRHNPFVYYPPIVENQARCDSHVRPYTDLGPALSSSDTTPNYVFITPDTCNDGHDAPCADGRPGGLVSADAWLSANVPSILASPAFADRGALVITFDEAAPQDDSSGCCASGVPPVGLDGGGRIGALVLSPLVRPGTTTATPYDHHSLLRTVEDGFGIAEHLNNAGSPLERSMADLFAK